MFQLKAEDRLRSWREFRSGISELPMDMALLQVSQFWSKAPFTPYHLDHMPESWPDPWTLIEENYYCDVAKALGMLYTISLTTHKKDLNVEFRTYSDDIGHEYNLVWINKGKYILNLIDCEVVNIEQFDKTLKLCRIYLEEELKINSY